MTFFINGPDEPRVAFNYRDFGARDRALKLTNEVPFNVSPNSTSEFFNNRSGCTVLVRPEGFTDSANDDISCEWSILFMSHPLRVVIHSLFIQCEH
jgi:hypothetical protein